MATASDAAIDIRREIEEQHAREDELARRELDTRLSNMQFYIELTENPEDQPRLDLQFDWSTYSYKNAISGSSVHRYSMPSEYHATTRDIDVHVRRAIERREDGQPLNEWLEDLAANTSCPIHYTNDYKTFTQAEFPSLTFSSHEYTLDYVNAMRLYVITVEHRIFDFFFYFFPGF